MVTQTDLIENNSDELNNNSKSDVSTDKPLLDLVDVGSTTKEGSSDATVDEFPPNPMLEAPLLSRFLFQWPYKLLKLGMERPLTQMDLPQIPHDDSSAVNRKILDEIWEKELKKNPENPRLHRAILKYFIKSLWYVQPLKFIATVAKVVQSVALGSLIETFESDSGESGYEWASVIVGCAVLVLFVHHHVFFWTWRKGMQLRIASVASIYSKSTRLPSTGSSSTSSGQVMNLSSNDVERFLLASIFLFYLFWAPAQSIAILGVGWSILGPAFAAGFALLMMVVVPLQSRFSSKFAKRRSTIAAITDKRVTLVSQAVYGARVMKMNGWEHQFEERIKAIRKEEVKEIWKASRLKALDETLFFSANIVVSAAIFVIHVFLGGTLTPRTVFTTLSLINAVQLEMTKHVSLAVMSGSECYVSITRIQKFLESPEINSSTGEKPETTSREQTLNLTGEVEHHSPTAISETDGPLLSLSNVTSHWNGVDSNRQNDNSLQGDELSDPLVCALDNVTLEAKRGKLTCIIGAVGSGKSALLQAIVGELPVSSGTLTRHYKTLAYAAQDAWIMDGSVKDNILMGLDFDADWYTQVVKACGLNVDFLQLRNSDETIVGDRGVQCSGGQRARIGLARALYRDADVLICDDPLSAVDSKVGRILFNEAMLGLGVNRGKCVILTTHQHQYIGEYECILMMGGRTECIGSYKECVTASGGKLTSRAQDNSVEDLTALEQDAEKKVKPRQEVPESGKDEVIDDNKKDEQKETNVTGLVKLETFVKYAKAMGGVWIGLSILFYFGVTQASALVAIATFGRWAERPPEDQKSWDIMGLVIGLSVAVLLLSLSRALLSFHYVLEASRNLHDRMTASVLRAKISFFDTNPMGRILNRFSADVGSNDDRLSHTLIEFLMHLFVVLGALITTISVLPFVLLVVPPLIWYFLRVRKIFVTTTRELKRLEGVARSPIFAMMSEAISGIATIRANNTLSFFRRKFEKAHDNHTRAFVAFTASSRWLGFRMDALMVVFLSFATFLAVLFHQQDWFGIDPAILGLSLSMLMQLVGLFQWCIRQSAEVVIQMVGVERVLAFGDLPSEDAFVKDVPDIGLLKQNWPHEGSIEVRGFSTRYRPNLPLSLKNLTLSIQPGHRVGVVGRTGSGKSTLVQALFRLLEAEDGCIEIDGVNIASVGLHTLRSKMSVIPQVPVLFSGCTVRENLDPFSKHSDESIREALRDVHMEDAILRELPMGWDSMVSENGSNFSVGQRQLLCLARAVLNKNKILLLDEPTANVDSRTDELLQEALQKQFKGSTIIAVAHRLDTIIDYDRIVVLGHGEVLEYGAPADLLKNPDGHFSSMVRDTGEIMEQELKNKAVEASKVNK